MTDNATINVSVSSHYRENAYGSETDTQGILGEHVEIVEHHPLYSKIKQGDSYVSWISSDQLAVGESPTGKTLQVRSHFMRIRKEPSEYSEIVRDGVIGSKLVADDERDGWIKYNSFNDSQPDFSRDLLDTFISVNRYPLLTGSP